MTGPVVHLTNEAGANFTVCGRTISKLDPQYAVTVDFPVGITCHMCRDTGQFALDKPRSQPDSEAPVKAVDGALYHLKAWSSERTPCGRRLVDFATSTTEFWTQHVGKVNCPGCIATNEYQRAHREADAQQPPPVDMSLPAVQARRAGADMLHIYETLTRVNPRLSHVDAWHMAGNLYGDGLTISRPE